MYLAETLQHRMPQPVRQDLFGSRPVVIEPATPTCLAQSLPAELQQAHRRGNPTLPFQQKGLF
jgi:hypothetical protein